MRRSISREKHEPNQEYLASREAAVEALSRPDLTASLDPAKATLSEYVIAFLADIPVRSRLITLTYLNDGTVGIYYSSGETLPRIGRSGKRLPPACKLILSRLGAIAGSGMAVNEVESISSANGARKTRVYFRCIDGIRRVDYDMDHLGECDDGIRSLDTMIKDLLRMIRRSKERTF